MRLSYRALHGMTVIAGDGHAIGELLGLFLDGETWRVESLQIKLRPDIADRLGTKRSMFHAGEAEIPIGLVQSVGDALILSVDVERLRHVLPGLAEPVPIH